MLLIGTIWLGGYLAFSITGQVVQWCALPSLLIGVGLAGLDWRLQRPNLTTFVAALTVEELMVLWLSTSVGGGLPGGWGRPHVELFLAGVFTLISLGAGLRVSGCAGPLQGIWLQRLIAGGALLALVDWPFWLYVFDRAGALGLLLWPLLPCVLVAAYYIARTADTLARHSLACDWWSRGPTT